MEWIRRHPIGAAFAAVAGLLIIAMLLNSLGSGEPTSEAVATVTTTTIASPDPTVTTTDRPQVPPVDCGPLITLEEVDDALGAGPAVCRWPAWATKPSGLVRMPVV